MPYTEQQRKAASLALAAIKGNVPKSKLKGAAKQMMESMTRAQLEDFARGPIKKRRMA